MNFKIEQIDKNMVYATTLKLEKLEYHHYLNGKFDIKNAYEYNEQGHCLTRLPLDFLNAFEEKYKHKNITNLSHCQAGVRVRFRTNSPYIAIKSKIASESVSGFMNYDLYSRNGDTYKHVKALESFGNKGEFETYANVYGVMTDYELYFPILCPIADLWIGLKENSQILPPTDYKIKKPIVFYGSSITHGANSLRPGNSYTAVISRALCADYINLGFSGSAKGEPELAQYISNLEMSAFVFDYDHNAPTPEHLRETHEPFYKIVREKQPNLPIIMVTRPNVLGNTADDMRRRKIVFDTYKNAKQSGDNNVYFVDGSMFLEYAYGDTGLSDACHPTEVGFLKMAETICGVLRRTAIFEEE